MFLIGLVGFAVSLGARRRGTVVRRPGRGPGAAGRVGAMLAPAALGTLVSTFSDPRERGKAFGVFGTVAAGGGAVGLILGGMLDRVPVVALVPVRQPALRRCSPSSVPCYIREQPPGRRPRIDIPAPCWPAPGSSVIVFGFSHAETAGWTAAADRHLPGRWASSCWSRSSSLNSVVKHPLLPLRVVLDRARGWLIRSRRHRRESRCSACSCSSPTTCRSSRDTVRSTTGLLFLPMIGCILISSNLSSIVLLPRLGPRILITTGMVLGAAGTELPDAGSPLPPATTAPCCPPC